MFPSSVASKTFTSVFLTYPSGADISETEYTPGLRSESMISPSLSVVSSLRYVTFTPSILKVAP